MSQEKWASWQQLAAQRKQPVVEVKSQKIAEPKSAPPPPAIEPVIIPDEEPVESVEITADILAEEPKQTLKKIKKNTD